MVLACVIAGSHAYLVARERWAWTVITLAMASWTLGELWYAVFRPPRTRRRRTSASSPSTRSSTSASSCSWARAHARSAARSGSTARIAALAAGALGAAVLVELVLEQTSGSHLDRRHEPRVPARRRPSAVGRLRRLRAHRRATRSALAPARARDPRDDDGRLDLPLPVSEWNVRRRHAGSTCCGRRRCCSSRASAWMSDRTREGLEVEGRPLLVVPARLRARRDGHPRLRPLHSREPARGRARDRRRSASWSSASASRSARTGASSSSTHAEATTDVLTGLSNRRQLISDLDRRLARSSLPTTLSSCSSTSTASRATTTPSAIPRATRSSPRLGAKLAQVPGEDGSVYRLGGDEFCLIATVGDGDTEALIHRACEALSERGEGFEIGSSFGAVMLPDEAPDSSHALQIADERLYAQKYSRRGESGRTVAALLEALAVREPDIQAQTRGRQRTLGRGRADARAPARRARGARASGAAPRPRQARRSRRDPAQAWPARRARVGVRPPAHDRRRADPAGLARPPQRRDDRALIVRELGRQRAIRTGSPATRSRSARGSSVPATPTSR